MIEEIVPIYTAIFNIQYAYIIGYNGAICVKLTESNACKQLFYFALPKSAFSPLFEYCTKNSNILICFLDGKNHVLAEFESHEQLDKYTRITNSPPYTFLNSYDDALMMQLTTSMIICSAENEADTTMQELKQLFVNNHNIHIVKTHCATLEHEQFYVEILNKFATKGNALKTLCEKLQVDAKQVLAFGDGDNDVEMFQFAGHSICMANGCSRLQHAATHVSQYTNDQEAVHQELVKLMQID
jgi:hydroxymethylpyrimidine pyrophosphatase-like HAD family hydrolase